LALPFSISSAELTALNGLLAAQEVSLEVKELTGSTLEGEHLTLIFGDATSIEAGKPYLVKVSKALNLATLPATIAALGAPVNPFHDAEIRKDPVIVEKDYVNFVPTLGKTLVTGPDGNENDTKAVLFVAANNTLKNPEVVNDEKNQSSFIKGFRAYFQLTNAAASARSFALNLGDETTGITSIGQFDNLQSDDCYDLSGRKLSNGKLSNRQMNKGVYIVNGKKVIK